jgi:hypothetical protein
MAQQMAQAVCMCQALLSNRVVSAAKESGDRVELVNPTPSLAAAVLPGEVIVQTGRTSWDVQRAWNTCLSGYANQQVSLACPLQPPGSL